MCKVEFEDYFSHVVSESHKNSIHLHQKSYDLIDDMFDELYVDFQEKYPPFKCYKNCNSSELDLSMIQKEPTMSIQEQQSTHSQLAKLGEPSNKIEEPSLEQEGEEDDEQINVIVEEISNDFTNRKVNEQNTPMKGNLANGEYSKYTPNKSILNSQQILSDMKSD